MRIRDDDNLKVLALFAKCTECRCTGFRPILQDEHAEEDGGLFLVSLLYSSIIEGGLSSSSFFSNSNIILQNGTVVRSVAVSVIRTSINSYISELWMDISYDNRSDDKSSSLVITLFLGRLILKTVFLYSSGAN